MARTHRALARPRLSTRSHGRHLVLTPRGELDVATVLPLTRALDALTGIDRPHVIVDLGEVTFLGARAISVLARGRERAHARNGDLRLFRVDPFVRHVLQLPGLRADFDIIDTLPAVPGESARQGDP
ncbi:STAS domain-containing protein (plasmid) [Embleya sp. NBC_00888]|uniref:STAS domain-containing protein n=1 Tax=Embleya sp. NBC_00888 TaxID=2975960 RepID=UPI002F9185E3|nr:STAS domain-containing protein [Embleya sp. NBC_00888]